MLVFDARSRRILRAISKIGNALTRTHCDGDLERVEMSRCLLRHTRRRQAKLVPDAGPIRTSPSHTERNGLTIVEVTKHRTLKVFERCLVVLLGGTYCVRICRVDEVDRIKVHHLVSECMQLLDQVLLSVLEGLASVLGALRLTVHDFYEQHEHLLELFRHDVSYVEHALVVDLVKLKLEHGFNVAAVSLQVYYVG